MSDHIPLDMQSEIIKRLPVKSVIQFRSVSKIWKSLIDSSKFIKSYQPQHHHLLFRYGLASQHIYASIMDDDTFPNHKSLTIPQPVNLLEIIFSLTSLNGLLCVYGWRQDDMIDKMAVLWNPSIVKAVAISIPNSLLIPSGYTYVGFGVCPDTSDFKLVKINTIGHPRSVNWEVEVFTLSTRVWKNVSNNIPPAFRTCNLTCAQYFVDGFIYWCAYDNVSLRSGIRSNMIISFDLRSHEFGEVSLPDSLVHTSSLQALNLYESLCLFEYHDAGDKSLCDVWIMKESGTKAFSKMLSIKALDSWVDSGVNYSVCWIRRNGEVILDKIVDINCNRLEVYEPLSGRISGMGIDGHLLLFDVNSYMETLLLLDESNSIIH